MKKTFLIITLGFTLLSTGISAGKSKVNLIKGPAGYTLTVDDEPFFVKGAVGDSGLELIKEYGGNAIRSNSSRKMLDEAERLGMKVLVNLPVLSQRDGFDYSDKAAVKEQFEKIIRIVEDLKDHPAVLMWALGNELDHVPQKVYEPNKIYYNMQVWDAVNDLAAAIHKADPNHPVLTVVGSITEHKINAIINQCPDLDLLGINEYGDLLQIPSMLREWGWNKPYVVTEWGPTGFWQMPATSWGYHIEENSSEKAEKYRKRYEGTILRDKEMCLGSFVFLWRQHQEYTHTWFGMFDKEWRETEAVDVMRYEWTGKFPSNRATQVDSMKIESFKAEDDIIMTPGKEYSAEVWMQDPDGDEISYSWEILPEQTSFGYGGNGERKPSAVNCITSPADSRKIRFSAPEEEGAYRLFVYGYDGNNHFSYSNIPFYVRK